jgi:AcrR family transcriptional regulator
MLSSILKSQRKSGTSMKSGRPIAVAAIHGFVNDPFSEGHEGTREKIVSAAIRRLNHGGRDAVTTRAVAEAAEVQAPTIYRLFGDKGGLLDAVAEYGFAAYLSRKKVRKPSPDPVENLRTGWDLHVDFGLSNPALYALMYGDPKPGASSPAATASYMMLREHIRSIAAAGRLRMSDERAANLVHASACGTVLTLLAMPEKSRDLTISEIARENILVAITTETPMIRRLSAASAAVALAALLPKSSSLSGAERQLLDEWLKRIANEPD